MKIEGKNAVRELLSSGQKIDRVYVLSGTKDAELRQFANTARERGALVEYLQKPALDGVSETKHHQGIVAICSDYNYFDLADVVKKGKTQTFILLDGLKDPHNLGSILRVADCAGVDAVIIPERRSVGVNETVVRVSAGATTYVKVVRVKNLNNCIDFLKQNNVWVYGADMNGQNMHGVNFSGSTAIVIGAEGEGLSELVKKKCDQIVSIPMFGKINSLNASVSAGILIYEVLRQRGQ